MVVDAGPKKTANKHIFRSERRSVRIKSLTEPTLLEMSGNYTSTRRAGITILAFRTPLLGDDSRFERGRLRTSQVSETPTVRGITKDRPR